MISTDENEKREKSNPILRANFLSKWLFWWTRHVFKKGFREQLKPDDLYDNLPYLDSQKLSHDLIKYWELEVRREKPNLLRMIFSAYGWKFVPICIFYSILEISIHAAQPYFLGGLVSYFAVGQTHVSQLEAYLYALGIILCTFVAALCFHPFMFYVFDIGTRVRLACSGLIYRKCLRSSVNADNSGLGGFAISVLSTDLPQFDLTFYFFHDLWKGPIEACVFGYMMYREISWPAIIGIAAIAFFIPLQAWAAKAAAYYRQESAEHGDSRVKLMNEIITAIQVIKMYAWEKSFSKLIAIIRKKEVAALRGSMYIYAGLQCTKMISKFALFLTLVTYFFTGEIVSARKIFLTSSYFTALNESLLHFWPLALTTWAETIVCARRVVTFLMQSEDPADGGIENFGADLNESNTQSKSHGRVHNSRAIGKNIIMKNVSASWDKLADSQKCTRHIKNIDFHIGEGQFIGIIGNVGAGKTTLLNAILGELEIVQGNIEVSGIVSYAPQDAWIFEGTIRENIVFVEKYDERRYKNVLNACELERDLELFPFGDSTIVGERGVSLSGGQKARISLARAVYRQADIYLFDDPLSAVDSYVGKRLMDKCFQKLLDGKIRVLVTHHIQHMAHVNHVILMEDGAIEQQGSYESLRDMLKARIQSDQEALRMSVLSNNRPQMHHADSIVEEDTEKQSIIPDLLFKDKGNERSELQMEGSVKAHTYLTYFRALPMPSLAIGILILFMITRASQSVIDIFISKWATWEESLPADHESNDDYRRTRQNIVIFYTILILSTLVLFLFRTYGFFVMCLRISLRLHDMLFNGIIRAYMHFFNTNASGRILNRFSKDMSDVDVALPQSMLDTIGFFMDSTAVLIVVATANYWMLIPAILLICLLYVLRSLYIGASRSLKRIESLTRSPIYSHTNQTIQGLTTIRALNASRQLDHKFHCLQNHNTSALFLYVTTNRAFAFWTDIICGFYILAVTLSFMLMDKNFYSGDVGLAITQSMTLIIMCQWGIRRTAEMENNMTSVERIEEYIRTPREANLETTKEFNLSADWPKSGRMQFKELRLRYTENGPYILKGLNFFIKPTEKIGIVGRTGAGKSSIIQAIFRLAINEGYIGIDGLDIAQLGLHDLRSRISIIPQDPVLFTGTLRHNLDPFEEKTDEEMWHALADVELKSYVKRLDGGLECPVYDGGANFSTGQRQLVCLARAILRHNKILIMDEATANVDSHTDKLIQDTIQTNFSECTVITIAHRLHTVMDNDRVMVMDAGQVVELDHPHMLLQKKDGFLSGLVAKTGDSTARHLRMLAKESYYKRNVH